LIRVLIADDHPVVRKGLSMILSEADGIQVVAEANNAQEVLDTLPKLPVDVLVLDIGMPGRSGLEILQELRQHYPKLPVLILSQYPEEQIAVRAIRAGAAGYLNKESAPEQLVDAVRRVFQGRKFLTATLAELLAVTLEGGVGEPHEALSDREYQVLRMIASGKTVSDIAGELNLSVKTVSTYRTRILEKMNLKNNAELTRYAIQNKIVS
jgi:two-component system, NarL family, invasion response regulator UvrY